MNKYIVLVLIALSFSGCIKNDLLDSTPKDRLNNENYWESLKDAEYAVNYLYTFLNGDMTGRDLYSDIMIDNYAYDSDNRRILRGIHQADLGIFNNEWVDRYKAVKACSNFFENVDKVAEEASEEELALLERMKGEAHFIRAYAYTYLAFYFGDVPYVDKSITVAEGQDVTRDPVMEVWEKVFADYDQAIDRLPKSYESSNYGRITKGAAMAMKAKASLYAAKYSDQYYDQAYREAKKVIDLNVYSLYPDYGKLFMYEGEASSETVLSRVYIGGGSHNHNTFSQRAPKSLKNGSPYYSATKSIADAYQMANGKDILAADSGFDPTNPYESRDPRMKLSLFVNGDDLFGLHGNPDYPEAYEVLNMTPGSGTPDDVSVYDLSTPTGFYIKKYLDISDYASPGLGGIDFMLIRYADVLLMAAEGLIESGGNLTEAAGYIDEVRQRVAMPGLEASGVYVTDKSAMRQALRNERLVELAFEGERYIDIIRWKTAEDVLAGDIQGMRYVEEGQVKVVTLDFTKAFDPNRDYLWPIPSTQIKLSPQLSQNPGY